MQYVCSHPNNSYWYSAVNGFHQWCGAVSSKVSSPTLAQDENWFLCMSAILLSWYGVLSVVRWSSVTARWSHVVRLWSLLTICWVMVEWVAPLVAVADGAVDCGSVGSSTARWSLIWWSLPTVQLLQNSLHCFVNFVLFVCLTCMYFLCAVCPCVYTCPRVST